MTPSGAIFARQASVFIECVLAEVQDRPDVARKRARWQRYQGQVDPQRLVFIDVEAGSGIDPGDRYPRRGWTKTNMAPLRGWGPRDMRLKGRAPFGHWNTMTFLAALRHDRIGAPWVFEVEPWSRHWYE